MASVEDLLGYAKIAGKGFVAHMAPSVLQGALVERLRTVSIKEAVQWVNNNTSLWDYLGQESQEGLKMLSQKVGSLDWLTADWVIDSLRKDCPTLASLFLGWRKAHNWLVRQVEIIQREVEV